MTLKMSSIHVQDIAQSKMLTLFGMTIELHVKAWGDTFTSFKILKEPMVGHKKVCDIKSPIFLEPEEQGTTYGICYPNFVRVSITVV